MIQLFQTVNHTLAHNFMCVPSPINLSYAWNFGSILVILILIQVVSGILLVFFFCAEADTAFTHVEILQRIVIWGNNLRWIHLNLASLLFLTVYFHIYRGIISFSFFSNTTWNTGITILILIMAIAFLGYVLPWGQISFWAATVITKFFSVIPVLGTTIVIWVWGGFSVNKISLIFFFCLHFLLPIIIIVIVIVHMFSLHFTGSSNPSSIFSINNIMFSPQFTINDIINLMVVILLFLLLSPWVSTESENFIIADYTSSPAHINPEWYFLFAYAILRSIPQNLVGVIGIFLSLVVPYLLSFININLAFNSIQNFNIIVWSTFLIVFFILTWAGGIPVTDLVTTIGFVSGVIYFSLFILVLELQTVTSYLIN